MDDALALDDDLDLLGGEAEQPHCLDQLKALVHQGGAVDGDLRAHVPVGVPEGVGLGLAPQLLGLHPEEGAAGGRQQDLRQALGALPVLQALEDGRVLAVHRQQLDAVLRHRLRHEMSAGDEALFVSEGEVMAALDGGKAGAEARDAHHAVQHHVRAIHGGEGLQPLGAGQELGRIGAARQCSRELLCPGLAGHADILGVELFDLL